MRILTQKMIFNYQQERREKNDRLMKFDNVLNNFQAFSCVVI